MQKNSSKMDNLPFQRKVQQPIDILGKALHKTLREEKAKRTFELGELDPRNVFIAFQMIALYCAALVNDRIFFRTYENGNSTVKYFGNCSRPKKRTEAVRKV